MKRKGFFYFVKSDRSVLLAVFAIIFVFAALTYFFGDTYKTALKVPAITGTQTHEKWHSTKGDYPIIDGTPEAYDHLRGTRNERFTFDPNTADVEQLLALGLSLWQVKNIYKYRSHGGIYRTPADFARLYGLTRKQFLELEPYINISSDYSPAAGLFPRQDMADGKGGDTVRYTAKLKPYEYVEINVADTSELKRIPGIGPYFARQIVAYRKRLGGFHSANQLLEIENFPEDAIKYLSFSGGGLQKINLNKLTFSQLRRHPYLNYYQAREIVDYRRLKGNLRSMGDLRLLKDFPPDEIKRLEPYVEF